MAYTEPTAVLGTPEYTQQLNANAQSLGVTPISSQSLSGNTTAVKLPDVQPNTTPDAIIASANQSVVDTQKQAEANVKAEEKAAGVGNAQAQKNGLMDLIKGLYSKESNAYTDVNSLPEKQQLLTEQKSLSDINTEIANETVKLRGEIDAIKGNGGISADASQSLLGVTNEKYGRKLADLAIRQSAASGNVTRLQSSLKDALDMKIAPIERELTYYKDFGIQNLDNLTKSENETLNRIIAEKKTLIDKETTDHNILATALKTASENGVKVPDSVVQQLQANPVQSYEILASNGITLVNPADQAKKYADAAKTRADAAGTDPSSTVTITNADGTKTTTTSQGVISSDAQDVLEGRNTLYNIRQTMGRTNKAAAYMQQLRNDIRSKDPQFDFVASDAGGKSVSTSYVQKSTAAINSVLPNIDKIVELSNQVPRVGVTGVDKIIQNTKFSLNNKAVANFHEAQKLIADEIGVALGAGTVSDMKLQLGFDVTNPNVSQEVFASNMKVVKEFLQNRKDGLNSLRYKSSTISSGSYEDYLNSIK